MKKLIATIFLIVIFVSNTYAIVTNKNSHNKNSEWVTNKEVKDYINNLSKQLDYINDIYLTQAVASRSEVHGYVVSK